MVGERAVVNANFPWNAKALYRSAEGFYFQWCLPDLNRGHMDFQSIALPTELRHHYLVRSAKNTFSANKGRKYMEVVDP